MSVITHGCLPASATIQPAMVLTKPAGVNNTHNHKNGLYEYNLFLNLNINPIIDMNKKIKPSPTIILKV